MSITKITDAERNNVRVTGLPDTPGLATREMQQRFDGLGDLAIDKINELVGAVNTGDIETPIKDGSGKLLNMYDAFTFLTNKISALEEALDSKIVSVSELPTLPEAGTIYLVQGEVTVN